MYGVRIAGKRPATKKAIKEALRDNPGTVTLDNTSMFGGYSGPVLAAPGATYTIVGPDPYQRKYFGNITVIDGRVTKFS